MFEYQDEPELLTQIQANYNGIKNVQSTLTSGPHNKSGQRSYRYTDESGATWPVFTDRTNYDKPLLALQEQIDHNVGVITRNNAQNDRTQFIARRKVANP